MLFFEDARGAVVVREEAVALALAALLILAIRGWTGTDGGDSNPVPEDVLDAVLL